MIAPDETTFEYVKGRPHAPQGKDWDEAVAYWKPLRSDDDATFDAEVEIDADEPRSPSSPGAPTPARACRCPPRSPPPRTSSTRPTATPPSGRWSMDLVPARR